MWINAKKEDNHPDAKAAAPRNGAAAFVSSDSSESRIHAGIQEPADRCGGIRGVVVFRVGSVVEDLVDVGRVGHSARATEYRSYASLARDRSSFYL